MFANVSRLCRRCGELLLNLKIKTMFKFIAKLLKNAQVPQCDKTAVIRRSEQLVCPHCGKCYINYDYDGSRLGWECKRLP